MRRRADTACKSTALVLHAETSRGRQAGNGTDTMYERHENEQYFFDEKTLQVLSDFLMRFDSIGCVCAPLLGSRLVEQGANVTILDIDERFAHLPGFVEFDVHRPHWIGRHFDVIVCDPPFYSVSLSQLFAALRLLSQHRFDQPLLVSYLKRRETAIMGTFTKFGLAPTGFEPDYVTVQECERNRIEFYSNLPMETVRELS